jgi:hypothetical protein
MRRREFWTFTALIAAAALPARASLYNWATDPAHTEQTTTVVTEPTGYNNALQGREITKLWFAQDATNYYFRLDLAFGPTNIFPHGTDFAEAYAIDITGTGGGDNAQTDPTYGSNYIADGLSDIKYLVMTHAAASMSGLFTMDHLHTYDLGSPDNVDTSFLVASEGSPVIAGAAVSRAIGVTEMDWQVPISALPAGPFTIYGSTVNSGDGDTYDVTGPIVVPEPAILMMMLAGSGLLLARRPRRTDGLKMI